MKKLFLTTAIALTLVSFNVSAKKSEIEEPNTYELLNLFGEVMERAKSSYVEPIKDQKLIEAAINGMLSDLDPHSSFLNAKDFKYMNEQTKGKFGGLGIEVTMESGVVKVVSPIDDTPAFKAGIKAGDYITHINGEQVMGMSLNDAVAKMRGKVGEKIKISIRRLNQKPFDVELKRQEIKITSVKSEIKADDVLYLRISSFNEDSDELIKKAFDKHLSDKIKALVIDVRNNPGGLLDQAVNVSDLFLDKGEIVSTRARNDEDTVKYMAKSGDAVNGRPIVVLINEGSASAAEILAGALQDHKRAVIMGEKSFGKGSVQTIIPLSNYGAMKITTARYYTPSGRSIQATGIIPDVEVKPAKVEVFEKNFDFGEATLGNSLKNENAEFIPPEEKKKQDESLTQDYQLSRAVDLAKALSVYSKK